MTALRWMTSYMRSLLNIKSYNYLVSHFNPSSAYYYQQPFLKLSCSFTVVLITVLCPPNCNSNLTQGINTNITVYIMNIALYYLSNHVLSLSNEWWKKQVVRTLNLFLLFQSCWPIPFLSSPLPWGSWKYQDLYHDLSSAFNHVPYNLFLFPWSHLDFHNQILRVIIFLRDPFLNYKSGDIFRMITRWCYVTSGLITLMFDNFEVVGMTSRD